MMSQNVAERYLVSPFLVFFLVHGTQIGVGVLSFQRIANEIAGHDSWISVIIAGCVTSILLWMIYKILEKSKSADLIDVHKKCFGRWVGNLLSMVFFVYFLSLALIVLRFYIEIVQVWIFPEIGTWQLSLIMLILVYYAVTGGFRIVTELCFWGVVLPSLIFFPMLLFPLEFAHIQNLFPIFEHSIGDILRAAKEITISFTGFEALLIYFPFIKNQRESFRWAQFGVGFTTLLYLTIMLISLTYFNERQLHYVIWPTLTLAKIPEIPFIERMEFIIISVYVLVIFPIICVLVWSVTRGIKRITSIQQRKSLFFILILMLVGSIFLDARMKIEQVSRLLSNFAFYLLAAYIPFLYIYVSILKFFKKGRKV